MLRTNFRWSSAVAVFHEKSEGNRKCVFGLCDELIFQEFTNVVAPGGILLPSPEKTIFEVYYLCVFLIKGSHFQNKSAAENPFPKN